MGESMITVFILIMLLILIAGLFSVIDLTFVKKRKGYGLVVRKASTDEQWDIPSICTVFVKLQIKPHVFKHIHVCVERELYKKLRPESYADPGSSVEVPGSSVEVVYKVGRIFGDIRSGKITKITWL
jgi:hypothetical protein